MKTIARILCSLILLAAGINVKALTEHTPATTFAHLYEVNKEWAKYQAYAPRQMRTFKTDAERITCHLLLVEKYLRDHIPAGFSPQALSHRAGLLDVLHRYALEGTFPENSFHHTRQPYFIDHSGVHCAVGYLIAASGREDLAQKIRSEYNYEYLAGIKTAGLKEWAVENGFTPGELAWIQPSYAPKNTVFSIGDGPNRPISNAVSDYQGRYIFCGTFDSVANLPCVNVGYYQLGQFGCLGKGLDGTVYDLAANINGIFAAGSILRNDSTFPVAVYNGSSWKYIGISERPNATGRAVLNIGNSLLEVVIDHPTLPQTQEIWTQENGNWKKRASITGQIRNIESTDFGFCYVGHFNAITVHRENMNDTLVAAKNAVLNQYSSWLDINQWTPLGDALSDTVLVSKQIGSSIYLGGTCSNENGKPEVCLSRYLNGTLQPTILNDNIFRGRPDCSIETIVQYSGSDLMIGGNFLVDPIIGDYGAGLAVYNVLACSIQPVANLNGKVTSMSYVQHNWYVSGYFTGPSNLEYIGKFDRTTGIKQYPPLSSGMKVYPNPASGVVYVESGSGILVSAELFDLSGRKIKTLDFSAARKTMNVDVSGIAAGTYLIRIKTDDGLFKQATFVVN